MFYKLLLGIFIFQGTFFGSNELSSLEEGIASRRSANSSTNTETCYQATGSLALLSAAMMHGLAAYCALLEVNKSENLNVKKALVASIVGNGAAAAGDAIAAIIAPFSGKGTASILAFTYGVSFWIANIPSWVAIGFEDHTGSVGSNLTASACLSSLSIIPATVGICSSFAANNDSH